MRINQNAAAFHAYRTLSVTSAALDTSLWKAPACFGVDGATEAESALAKSASSRTDLRSSRQAIVNVENGLSKVQREGGALDNLDAAIAAVDGAIHSVSTRRCALDAARDRLEHQVAKLSVAIENSAAAESRARDTDIALEMADLLGS